MKKSNILSSVLLICCLCAYSEACEFKGAGEACSFALIHEENLMLGKQIASMKIKNSRWNIGDYIPCIEMSYSDSSIVFHDSPDSRNKNLSFGLSYVLFDGGKRKLNYTMGNIQNMYAWLENEEEVQYLCIDILQIYNSCFVAKKTFEADERLYENGLEVQKTIQMQHELGMILETDLLEYEISMMELKNRLESDKAEYESLLRQLKLAVGLDLRAPIEIKDNVDICGISKEILPNIDGFYSRAVARNLSLRKMLLSMDYDTKQEKLKRAFYVPSISVQPSIAFQGESFPLHDPKGKIQVSFSFDHNPFIPFKVGSSVSIDGRKISGVTDSLDGQSTNVFDHFTDANLSKLGLLKMQAEYRLYQKKLYSQVHELCDDHDRYVNSLDSAIKTFELQKKLMEVSRHHFENGNMKYTDFLEVMIDLSLKEIEIAKIIGMIDLMEEKLSVLTGVAKENLNDEF